MTYTAVNDLSGLLSLHLPYGSNKEHLQSLYFLKKAFNFKGDQDEIVTVNYYCQSCFSGLCKVIKIFVQFVEIPTYYC